MQVDEMTTEKSIFPFLSGTSIQSASVSTSCPESRETVYRNELSSHTARKLIPYGTAFFETVKWMLALFICYVIGFSWVF